MLEGKNSWSAKVYSLLASKNSFEAKAAVRDYHQYFKAVWDESC